MKQTEKQAVVEKLSATFSKASVILLAKYAGLAANEMNVLRKQCRGAGLEFQVVKNTMARLALKGTDNEFLGKNFKGPIAVLTGVGDQVSPAKILVKAAKDYKALEIVCGALDGRALDANGVETLSKMPGKNELRAQLLGLFTAVPGGFVRLLNAVPGGMVNVLDARRRKLEEAA